jgi:hypothetical protein
VLSEWMRLLPVLDRSFREVLEVTGTRKLFA